MPHGESPGLHGVNLGLRFLLELATLAALAYWGVHTGRTLLADLILGVGAPVLAAVVWGVFAAPRSARRLRGPALTAVQLAVFAAGIVALAVSGHGVAAGVLAALVIINAVLIEDWREH